MKKILLNATNKKLTDLKTRLEKVSKDLKIEWESENVISVSEHDYNNLVNGLHWMGIQFEDYDRDIER